MTGLISRDGTQVPCTSFATCRPTILICYSVNCPRDEWTQRFSWPFKGRTENTSRENKRDERVISHRQRQFGPANHLTSTIVPDAFPRRWPVVIQYSTPAVSPIQSFVRRRRPRTKYHEMAAWSSEQQSWYRLATTSTVMNDTKIRFDMYSGRVSQSDGTHPCPFIWLMTPRPANKIKSRSRKIKPLMMMCGQILFRSTIKLFSAGQKKVERKSNWWWRKLRLSLHQPEMQEGNAGSPLTWTCTIPCAAIGKLVHPMEPVMTYWRL